MADEANIFFGLMVQGCFYLIVLLLLVFGKID
jgi:hypothetical protein